MDGQFHPMPGPREACDRRPAVASAPVPGGGTHEWNARGSRTQVRGHLSLPMAVAEGVGALYWQRVRRRAVSTHRLHQSQGGEAALGARPGLLPLPASAPRETMQPCPTAACSACSPGSKVMWAFQHDHGHVRKIARWAAGERPRIVGGDDINLATALLFQSCSSGELVPAVKLRNSGCHRQPIAWSMLPDSGPSDR